MRRGHDDSKLSAIAGVAVALQLQYYNYSITTTASSVIAPSV